MAIKSKYIINQPLPETKQFADHPYSYNSRAKSPKALAYIYFRINDIILATTYYNQAIDDYKSILKIAPKTASTSENLTQLENSNLPIQPLSSIHKILR